MGHKALKVSLIVVLGLFAFTALAGIAAYWRLTMGPLPISFLQSSIENAIKLARLYTGRHKILSRYQS